MDHSGLFCNSAANGYGGGVCNGGTMTLEHCALFNNSAVGATGGVYNDDGSLVGTGILKVDQRIIAGNSAPVSADLFNAVSATLIQSTVFIIVSTGPLTWRWVVPQLNTGRPRPPPGSARSAPPAPNFALVGPTTPTRAQGLPLALWRLERL
jgi:hypothetical protein